MLRIHFRGFISILLMPWHNGFPGRVLGALHRAMPEAMDSVRGEH